MTEPVTPHAAQSWGRAAYDAYAEGLFTYCLSMLGDHTAAGSSLRSTFVLADRHIGRLPDLGLLKPWLYALARFECLVRLDAGGPVALPMPASAPDPAADAGPIPEPVPGHETPDRERSELALLAWPEAVGLAPAHREALELAVRHGLDPRGLGAVLGWEEAHARRVVLLAGREVDRTRAALEGARAAMSCPDGPGLVADVAGPGARDRLVAHVDECVRCRPYARLAATRLTPTTGPAAPAQTLPMVAPPAGLRAAVLGDVGRGRSALRPAELRGRVAEFDRTGFPVFHSRTGRRRTDRTRMTLVAVAVATIATVPVMVLWQAAHHGDRHTARGTTISAARVTSVAPEPGHAGEPAGHTGPTATASSAANSAHHPAPQAPLPSGPPGEHAEPLQSAAATPGPTVAEASPGPSAPPGTTVVGTVGQGPVASAPAPAEDKPLRPQSASGSAADRRASPLVVEAEHNGERTVVTLRNTGAASVDWTAEPSADWLRLSRTTGTLAPGAAETITVTVDSATAPSGSWSANVLIQPGGSRVWIEGSTGGGSPTTTAEPTATGRPPATSAPPSEPAGGR